MYRSSSIVAMVCLFMFFSSNRSAADVIINGSFETGDYSGWRLVEGEPPHYGTWGIAQDAQTIDKGDVIYDFCDKVEITQISSGLPLTYSAADGNYLAIQLQVGGQEHRMFQDVRLPETAKSLKWSMFYDNKSGSYLPDQYLAVHIRDLNDQILETLFLSDAETPQTTSMQEYSFDISEHAGSEIRIDVEMKVQRHFFEAGFDNFVIIAEDSPFSSAPRGWSRRTGKKIGSAMPKGLQKKEEVPKGFQSGNKNGWNK